MKRLGLFMTVIMILCITVNAQKQSNRTLVAYFSATGTTEKAAKQIAEVTGGALYEIQPAKKYTSADLDWHDKSSRSSVEMADASSRPALRSQPQNLAAYDTIYIGFPIWWNLAPRIINSFIEKGDFTGKILIPFATSGGSRISNAEQELKKAYPSLNWQKGRLMNGATKEEIKQWTKHPETQSIHSEHGRSRANHRLRLCRHCFGQQGSGQIRPCGIPCHPVGICGCPAD